MNLPQFPPNPKPGAIFVERKIPAAGVRSGVIETTWRFNGEVWKIVPDFQRRPTK